MCQEEKGKAGKQVRQQAEGEEVAGSLERVPSAGLNEKGTSEERDEGRGEGRSVDVWWELGAGSEAGNLPGRGNSDFPQDTGECPLSTRQSPPCSSEAEHFPNKKSI